LSELRYIDQALEYLEEEKASWWHGVEPIGPGTTHVTVTLGTTLPFTRRYEIPGRDSFLTFWKDSKQDEVNRQLRALGTGAEEWGTAELESFQTRVRPFTWLRPGSGESWVIEPLTQVHQRLEDDVDTDFGKLSGSLSNWEGDAADNFATYFYHPFEGILEKQRRLVGALIGGVEAADAIYQATQHSLMTGACHTRDALYEQLELRAQHAALVRRESIRNALVLAGAGASLIAAVTSGGLWSIGLNAAIGLSAAASTTIPPDAVTQLEIRGSSAEELSQALFEALREISSHYSSQHKELDDEVRKVLDRVEGLRAGGDGRLVPIRPEIVDGVDGDDFYLPPR